MQELMMLDAGQMAVAFTYQMSGTQWKEERKRKEKEYEIQWRYVLNSCMYRKEKYGK